MKSADTERVRSRILALIESEYDSDAAFERDLGLADKTVNNWRRGRSSSFMRMLPKLTEVFSVSISQIMDIPLSADNPELSEDEVEMLTLYRRARPLPVAMRRALAETLENTIRMYVDAYVEIKQSEKKSGARTKSARRTKTHDESGA